MATTKKRVRTTRSLVPTEDKHLKGETLRSFGKRNMTIYATTTNLDRSVPDLFDGLKPVHRRILWGMISNGGKNIQKAGEHVGFVLGKLHPHGDGSIYGAMVTQVNMPTPPIFGRGNWGSMVDGPAAYRYTECKLTEYGMSFMESDYIAKEVTMFVPNYNDKWVEPVTLPAQLPNIILNGGEGMGVGITTMLPTFTAESVVKVLEALLKGEKLQPIDFAKTMKFAHRWGGQLVQTKENKQQWLEMFKSPYAKVQFESDLQVDRDHKRIVINDWPPTTDLEKFTLAVRKMPECQSCLNSEGSTTFTIVCKPAFNFDQFDKFVEKVRKATMKRRAFKINVTRRTGKIEDGVVSFDTKIEAMSVPQLIIAWLRERIQVELRSLAYRISYTQKDIAYSELMIYAADHIDLIIKTIRKSEDPEAALVKALKITLEQAKQICDLQLRKISKLNQNEYKSKLKEQQALLKQLQAWQKKPKEKVLLDVLRVRDLIVKDQTYQDREDNQELTVV
jgi:DNA gyrase/topoisomerase IV subunit A